ncbi:MAG: response regulator transcription factor [Anaerolineaceae bacterium]|nr:response regulator transcription factor [Anaerolineaceae bacterium]
MMRILLADDHALFLDGLRNLLTLHGVQVVGTARNGLEALEKTLQLRPDIVLMDMRMPGCDGITATRLIKSEWPECKIIILTTSTEEPDLLEAIRSGANGYLLKSLETDPFLSYLQGVMRGEAAIARELSAILWKEVANQDDTNIPLRDNLRAADLTTRQIEILQLVAQGLTNKDIAQTLSVSEHTIKYHLSEIFQRLKVKNRDQAVVYALNNGLIR